MPFTFSKKKPESAKRTVRYPLMLHAQEADAIRKKAAARKLSVAEFFRNAALAREADVEYEMEVVARLDEVTRAIRTMHIDLVQHGIEPTADDFAPIIQQALNIMVRIEK